MAERIEEELEMSPKKKKEEIHCERCGETIDTTKSYYQVNYDKGENVIDKFECSPCYLAHVNISAKEE
jgi:C4-type Zn-finger protein